MRENTPHPKRTPVWQSIANTLRSDIAEHRYGVGDKLPTEAALAGRFGVNRHTVRHAIGQLVDEGLVRTRRGAGAFVAGQPTDYAIGKRVRFHENLLAAGRAPTKKILSLETRPAANAEAQALNIARGAAVLAYHGLSYADAQPIALAQVLFPVGRLAGLDAALRQAGGITAALAQIGVTDYTRATTRVTATLATATQALHLQVQEGAPLLRTSNLSIDGAGIPVELGKTWFAGDRVTLTLDA